MHRRNYDNFDFIAGCKIFQMGIEFFMAQRNHSGMRKVNRY
jgi:hypothetical protein